MPLADVYTYFRSYDKTSYEVVAQQGNEPKESDVSLLESQVGFRFPEEFREFAIHPIGGLYMAVKESLWPRPKAFQVGPFWSFLYGLMVYSLAKKAPDWLKIGLAWRKMSESGFPQFVPFLKLIGSADSYCFAKDQKIVVWRHETPESPEVSDEIFSQILMREIRELEDRKARKLRGEDASPPNRLPLP